MSAPPELLADLRARRYADPDGRLGPEAPRLAEALAEITERDRSAWVIVAPIGSEVGGWRSVWDELGLDPQRDLLVLYDGRRWEARGWGLDSGEITTILDRNEGGLKDGVGHGLEAALHDLEDAAYPASARSTVAVGGGAALGVAALAALAWIVSRRVRLQREEAEVARARAELDDAVAHLVLEADALGPTGAELQARAVRLQREVRHVAADEDVRIRVARIHQLEDEVAALQSQVLATRGTDPRTPSHLRGRVGRANPEPEG